MAPISPKVHPINAVKAQGRVTFQKRLDPAKAMLAAHLVRAFKTAKREAKPTLDGLVEDAKKYGTDTRGFAQDHQTTRLRGEMLVALAIMKVAIQQACELAEKKGAAAGMDYAQEMLRMVGVSGTQPEVDRIIAAAYYTRNPMFAMKLSQYPSYHADQMQSILNQGVQNGIHPIALAHDIVNYFDQVPYADAERYTRTLLIYASRQAAHVSYQANSDVLDGWVWSATLGPHTCMSCVALDGTVHSLDETLNDHDNGECAAVPLTKSWADLGYDGGGDAGVIETGIDWFEALDADTQQAMMGKAAYEGWKRGEFQISDYPTTYQSDIYGPMQREKSYKELVS